MAKTMQGACAVFRSKAAKKLRETARARASRNSSDTLRNWFWSLRIQKPFVVATFLANPTLSYPPRDRIKTHRFRSWAIKD